MTRLIIRATLGFVLLLVMTILVIHAQPYDDHTIRAILVPTDCHAPCFMGIQPGVTRIKDVYRLLEANPWVGDIASHIDSGCCTIALNWKWNGRQPANLGSSDNTIYLTYNTLTGAQIVQNIALHTQTATGYAILILGTLPAAESGALQGLNNAYVEVFYRPQMMRISTTIPCPLTRWRLWQAPMTLLISNDSRSMIGMKPMDEVC